jgi:hypothetical protein
MSFRPSSLVVGRILSSFCSLFAVAPIHTIAYNSADAQSIKEAVIPGWPA